MKAHVAQFFFFWNVLGVLLVMTTPGRTGFCTLCEGYAKKLEIAREALEWYAMAGKHKALTLTVDPSVAKDALARME